MTLTAATLLYTGIDLHGDRRRPPRRASTSPAPPPITLSGVFTATGTGSLDLGTVSVTSGADQTQVGTGAQALSLTLDTSVSAGGIGSAGASLSLVKLTQGTKSWLGVDASGITLSLSIDPLTVSVTNGELKLNRASGVGATPLDWHDLTAAIPAVHRDRSAHDRRHRRPEPPHLRHRDDRAGRRLHGVRDRQPRPRHDHSDRRRRPGAGRDRGPGALAHTRHFGEYRRDRVRGREPHAREAHPGHEELARSRCLRNHALPHRRSADDLGDQRRAEAEPREWGRGDAARLAVADRGDAAVHRDRPARDRRHERAEPPYLRHRHDCAQRSLHGDRHRIARSRHGDCDERCRPNPGWHGGPGALAHPRHLGQRGWRRRRRREPEARPAHAGHEELARRRRLRDHPLAECRSAHDLGHERRAEAQPRKRDRRHAARLA